MAISGAKIVRFPVEKRVPPSLDLLMDIAPDAREIDLIIESCALDVDVHMVRDAADRGMAERILNEVPPEPGARRQAALSALLDPLVAAAIERCAQADAAKAKAEAARDRTEAAIAEGGYWLEPLIGRTQGQIRAAAELMVEAYIAYQAALGAARAVRLARCHEEWQPFDVQAEAQALFFGTAPVTAADRTAR